MKLQDLKKSTSVKNILSIYEQATADEIREGLVWYKKAHVDALLGNPGVSIDIMAGVIAALSPRNKWETNLEDADKVVRAYRAGLSPDDIKVPTFGANKRKAFAIAGLMDNHDIDTVSEVERILSGNKTVAFYRNIRGDERSVCVDGHATHIALGVEDALAKAPELSTKAYEHIAHLYRNAAAFNGIQPAQMQAITWVTYRRIKGVS